MEKIGTYIAAFLKENREKCVALKQAWDACEQPVVVPGLLETAFRAGIKRKDTSTPMGSPDVVDGPRVKKFLKKFQATLPAVSLSCTSAQVEVKPEVPPSDEPSLDSSLIRHYMSGNQECVPENMSTAPLMTDEEMYNMVAEMDDDELHEVTSFFIENTLDEDTTPCIVDHIVQTVESRELLTNTDQQCAQCELPALLYTANSLSETFQINKNCSNSYRLY